MTSPSEEYYSSNEEFVRKTFGNRVSITTGSGAFRYRDIWLDRDNPRKKAIVIATDQRPSQAWAKAATYAKKHLEVKRVAPVTFQYILKLKKKPCKDCGRTYPNFVMEFDHVRGEKKFSICHGWKKHSLADVKEEIAKCELVCANCHRIRTISRMRHKKLSPATAIPTIVPTDLEVTDSSGVSDSTVSLGS